MLIRADKVGGNDVESFYHAFSYSVGRQVADAQGERRRKCTVSCDFNRRLLLYTEYT